MRKLGVALALWAGFIGAGWAQDEPVTLPWLKSHSDLQPKQVALAEDTAFTVVLDGRQVGSATVAAGTEVDLAAVGDRTITLGRSGGQAEVDPAKTDLWDRVRATRAQKEKDGAPDPSMALELPPDSLPAEWYASQLQDKFDPWLAAHPDHPRFDFVTERRAALAAEMSRVAAGEARHGDRWLSAEEVFEWKDERTAHDLRLRLDDATVRHDAPALQGLVPQVFLLAKAAAYPELVRAAIAAIDAAASQLTPDGAKASIQIKKDKLSADEAKLVADIKDSVGEIVPSSSSEQPGWTKWPDGFYRPLPAGEGDGHHYVFAHHYPGLLEFYPNDDPHSYYHVLPDAEVARLRKEASDVLALRDQKAALDRAMDGAVAAAARDRDQLAQLRAKLAAEPVDKMDLAAAKLSDASARLVAGDADGAKAIVAEADAAWPGSQAIARWKLDQASAALNDGKKPLAASLLGGVPDWPRAVRLRAATGAKDNPALAALNAGLPASTAAAPAPGVPDAPKTDEMKRHDASRAAWSRAIDAGKHGRVMDAWNAFGEAREQWPENPAVSDAMFYAEIAGGILALMLVLWLWKGRG